MSRKDRYYIDVYGLKNGTHQYDFIIDDSFFQNREHTVTETGKGIVNVTLERTDNHITVTLGVNVNIELICDRSLEPFEYSIETEKSIIFKFGDEEQELDVDMFMILRDIQRLNLDQHIYDYIGLSIPYKKLHPKFSEDEEKEEDELIFQTPISEEETEEEDPRWAELKKLKKN